MNYNELSELIKSKKILVKDLCEEVGYTRRGLQTSIDNETIELRKLKLICEKLRISPSLFFENGTYGLLNNSDKTRNQNMQIELLKKENELLKQRIADKDELLSLYREKINGTVGLVATTENSYKLKK